VQYYINKLTAEEEEQKKQQNLERYLSPPLERDRSGAGLIHNKSIRLKDQRGSINEDSQEELVGLTEPD